MNNSKHITLALDLNSQVELKETLSKQNIEFSISDKVKKDEILEFDAESARNLIVAIGGTGIVTALSQILATFIKERKKTISIKKKNGNIEVVADNFNAEELELIIKSLKEDDTVLIINRRISTTTVDELLDIN